VSLAELEAAAEQGGDALHALLHPIEAALQNLAEVSVGQNDAARLLRGQPILIRGRDAPIGTGATYATCKGQLIAVGEIDKGELRPLRVFNFSSAG
jgi:tRNA pseudouridine55 synthase